MCECHGDVIQDGRHFDFTGKIAEILLICGPENEYFVFFAGIL